METAQTARERIEEAERMLAMARASIRLARGQNRIGQDPEVSLRRARSASLRAAKALAKPCRHR